MRKKIICFRNSYLVKIFGLKASEISLLRGALQTLIFTILIALPLVNDPNKNQSPESETFLGRSSGLGPNLIIYCQVCVYGLLVSTCCFACMAALPLMPIGDVIVISFTAPIFSVVLERIFLSRKFTLLSILLCLIIGRYLSSITINLLMSTVF